MHAYIQIVHICGQPVRGARDPASTGTRRGTYRTQRLPSRDVLAQAFPGPGPLSKCSRHPRAINYAPVRSGEGEAK